MQKHHLTLIVGSAAVGKTEVTIQLIEYDGRLTLFQLRESRGKVEKSPTLGMQSKLEEQ